MSKIYYLNKYKKRNIMQDNVPFRVSNTDAYSAASSVLASAASSAAGSSSATAAAAAAA